MEFLNAHVWAPSVCRFLLSFSEWRTVKISHLVENFLPHDFSPGLKRGESTGMIIIAMKQRNYVKCTDDANNNARQKCIDYKSPRARALPSPPSSLFFSPLIVISSHPLQIRLLNSLFGGKTYTRIKRIIISHYLLAQTLLLLNQIFLQACLLQAFLQASKSVGNFH